MIAAPAEWHLISFADANGVPYQAVFTPDHVLVGFWLRLSFYGVRQAPGIQYPVACDIPWAHELLNAEPELAL